MTTGDGSLKPGWARVAFGDVVRLSRERAPGPEAAGFTRCVGLEHIDPGDLTIRRWGSVSDGTTFTNVFRPGQVLFGKRRAYLRKIAVPDFSGVCSGDIYVFESKDDRHLLPDLLPFICQTDAFFEHAVGTSAGSLSPRTNWQALATYEFALPPLQEQNRISILAMSLCALIRHFWKLETSIHSLRVAHLNDLYCRQGADDLREHDLESLLSDIEPGRSLLALNHPPTHGEPAVLKISAINPKGFRPRESKVLINPNEFRPEYCIRNGDLLMTRSNTPELVGQTTLVEEDYQNLMLSDKTLRLVPADGVDTTVLLHVLQAPSVRQQIASMASGTGRAMKNISQPEILGLSVMYPANAASMNRLRLLFKAMTACTEIIKARKMAAIDNYRRLLCRIL